MAGRGKLRNLPGRFVLLAARHPLAVRALVALLFLAGAWLIFRGHFSNDIASMLPDGSRSAKSYTEINRSGMFHKMILSFSRKDGRSFHEISPGGMLDRIAAELKLLPQVRRVEYQYLSGDPAEQLRNLVLWMPQLTSPSDLKTGREEIEKTVRGLFRRMLLPSSVGQVPLMRSDPFSLNGVLFQRLREFQSVTGLRVSPNTPYLITEDGKQAMMLLDTGVPVSDAVNARTLLASVHAVLNRCLPEEVACDVISAHRRAVWNESVLRGDVKTVCWMSTILFAVLFIVFYRCDVRSFLIPLIPVLASAIVLGGMTPVFENVLFFVVGMGGVVISLAVDYGIHTYAVMTGGGGFLRLIRIVPALCAGALTSIAAFLLFSFSKTEGIRQLGFFSGASLLLSLLLMLLLLPSILSGGKRHDIRFRAPEFPVRRPRTAVFIWLALLLCCVCTLPALKFHSDVRQFDVSPKTFDEEEKRVSAGFFSGPRPAMLLFQGRDAESVRCEAEKILSVLRGKTEGSFSSPTDLYPSRETREKNLSQWRAFLRSGEWAKLRTELNSSGSRAGFREEFFNPFYDGIRQGTEHPPKSPPRLLEPLLNRFEVRNGEFFTLAVLFPDRPELVEAVESLTQRTVVSQNGLAERMSEDVSRGMVLPGVLAVLLVVLITRAFFRSSADTLTALVPVLTSLVVTGAVFALCGMAVNLSVLIAAIILCGLSVDYGIFMTGSLRNGCVDNGIFNAVTLSAVTSAAGGATVIFTRHPMLRDAGLTLMIGITVAWLTGVLVVPAMKSLKGKPVGKTAILLLFCGLSGLLCTSCAFEPFEYEVPEGRPEIGSIADGMPPEAVIEASVVGEYRFSKLSLLSLTRIDLRTGRIHVAGLTPAGMKIFDLSGTAEHPGECRWIPGKYWEGHEEQASRRILSDISAIYRNLLPEHFEKYKFTDDGKKLVVREGDLRYVFAGAPPHLIEKTISENGSSVLRIRYYKWSDGFPMNISLENLKYHYRLAIRTLSVERGNHER